MRKGETLERALTAARTEALVREDIPCTFVFTDIDGMAHTIAVTNEAIAHRLGRPAHSPVMVEECSDFVNAHRAELVAAATKRLNEGQVTGGKIWLLPGDF